jgi:uncharacterized protein YndB with AHSA1/START domain
MTNDGIWHEVGIKASPADIYKALTDVDQLAKWWTSDTRGESKTGKTLEFRFNKFGQEMKVGELKAGELVRWLPTENGVPDWVGSTIEFAIIPADGQTFVQFRHSGWREKTAMYPHCSIKWAVFMLSLKDLVETGKGRPFPNDMQVNLKNTH